MGAARAWLVTGAVPLVVAMGRPALGRWLVPWGALVGSTLLWVPWVADPSAALGVARTQIGWLAALALGLSVGRVDVSGWAAAAGVVAAAPAWWVPGGAFGNTSLLAGFLAATVVLTAHGWRRWWIWPALGAQIWALWLSESLAAWLAIGAGGAAAAFARARPRGRAVIALSVGAALAATLLADDVRDHLGRRGYMAAVSADVARAAAPLGVGPGQLHGAFLEAQARRPASDLWTNATHAHAEPLHALAEQGVAGLLLLAVPFLAGLLRVGRDAAWPTLIACAVLAMFSLPLYEPGTAFVAALCTGQLLAEGAPRASAGWRRPAAVALGAAALLAASAALLADRLLVRGAEAADPALVARAALLDLRAPRTLRVWADISPDPAEAEALALESLRRTPSVEGWLLAGRAAMRQAAPERAVPAFAEAVRLHPRLFAGHFNLARAYEELGDRHRARRHATRARSLRPGEPRLRWLPR